MSEENTAGTETPTPDSTETKPALIGCNFDSMTAKATHGKNALMMISSAETGELLAIQAQQGLTFNVSVNTSSTETKDEGGWTYNTAGVKSFDGSCDALYTLDDPARKEIARSIMNGTPLCVGVYIRNVVTGGTSYQPIRKGMMFATGDSLSAPKDDNMTDSISLTGTGVLWMIETADAAEVEKMTVFVPSSGLEG